jgi:beta,beta-carotene 9',10'-dioxygenase
MKLKTKLHAAAELQEEVANRPLDISGTIPDWLSGMLVRNGPVTVTVNGQSNKHWFDGLAMLHAFSFQNGKIKYTNKFLRSDAYKTVFEEGSLNYEGFAVDPCRSIFKQLLTLFIPRSHIAVHNANINVSKLSDQYIALTEVPLPVKFDPETLDTLGVFDYQDKLPKDKCWESAHPHHDVEQKSMLNYLIHYGRTSYYTLYNITDGTAEPVFVATPKGESEDDGVVLSVVIDQNSKSSFLLILNGKNFKQIGRTYAPHLIPAGLHGQYYERLNKL